MHLNRILLATLVAIFARSSVLVVTKETNVSRVEQSAVADYDGVSQGRFLRAAKTTNVKLNVTDEEASPGAEERANPITSFFKKTGESITLSVKTAWWLERYKSVNFVQEKLGMKGLTGADLVSHKNYNRLVNYAKTLRENKILDGVRHDVSTYKVWDDMGLPIVRKDMADTDILALLGNIRKKEGYEFYRDYAVAFDRHKINLFSSGYNRPTEFFDKSTTPLEKMARIQIWVERKKDDRRVMEFLGLKHAKPEQLENDRFYRFYLVLKQAIAKE